jgi:hypothetical protein
VSLIKATITGNLAEALDGEVLKVAGALRRAVAATGRQVQGDLRGQARGAGFKDGGKSVANAWRLAVYPAPGRGPRTFRPAALVSSKMPEIVNAFDKGATITAKGGKYLAFPTGYNAARGRRNAGGRGGMRVTPDQMQQAGKRGEAFVLDTRNPRVRLWCLRVAATTGITQRTRKRIRLFVGTSTEVVTGKVKGIQQKRRDILAKGFLPMFFLMRQVTLRKRLDVAGIRAKAPAIFARNAVAELGRL